MSSSRHGQGWAAPMGELAPWSRRRLLVLSAAAAAALLLMATGLVFAVRYAMAEPESVGGDRPPVLATASAELVRDRIAAEPMLMVDRQAAFSAEASTIAAGTITVPPATVDLGPADVPTGFPRTAEGAAAQLAAIERTVLESMSLPVTRAVHAAWVLPGGPSLDRWVLTRNVQAFLAAARQAGTEKDVTTLVTVTPAAGLVKGADGPDWAVVCVLADVRAAVSAESRMGYGLCSRMQWAGGRWQVAAGAPPAAAPSTWPGSRLAVEAGWLTWVEQEA